MNSNDNTVRYKAPENVSSFPYRPLIYALLIVFGVLLGMIISVITSDKKQMGLRTGKYNKVEDIIDFVKLKYVDTVNVDQLTDQTIEKMLSTLDPHSMYIPVKEVANVNESLDGNFEGVGIEFFIVQDTITVVSAISGGPAELVGIHAGDKIVKIADTIVAGKKVKNEDVMHKLRGVGGTTVKVGILRSGVKDVLSFNIKRDKIPLYSIDAAYMQDEVTGYIKINRFSATTHKEFKRRITELNEKGMKNLIIDLRQNPGGYLEAATTIADELIAGEKMLVYTKGRSVEKQEYLSGRPGEFERGKLSILIDQGSASAAEILSGAVQDWDRGTIIGRTSFGKGLVQEQYELPDGSALRLTIARYYTPSGRCIQRPYNKGTDAYYNEVYDRFTKGDFVKQDTSKTADTTVYRTSKGKIVWGGGGIRPDIFVPLDTTEDFEYVYQLRSYIPEFIYKKYSANPLILDGYKDLQSFGKSFRISAEMQQEFLEYAQKQGFKYNEERYAKVTPKVMDYLKAYLAKQKWQGDGFYFILNQDDKVMEKALETFL